MDPSELDERIARAKQLLRDIHHIAIATVNDDGTPHNSPVFMAFDDDFRGYWASNKETRHSKNIARDPRIFMVVFDSREGHGGLFIKAKARALQTAQDAKHGHEVLKKLKQELYGDMGEQDLYLGDAEQRIYMAEPLQFWINKSDRNEQGIIVRDRRYEITLDHLR